MGNCIRSHSVWPPLVSLDSASPLSAPPLSTLPLSTPPLSTPHLLVSPLSASSPPTPAIDPRIVIVLDPQATESQLGDAYVRLTDEWDIECRFAITRSDADDALKRLMNRGFGHVFAIRYMYRETGLLTMLEWSLATRHSPMVHALLDASIRIRTPLIPRANYRSPLAFAIECRCDADVLDHLLVHYLESEDEYAINALMSLITMWDGATVSNDYVFARRSISIWLQHVRNGIGASTLYDRTFPINHAILLISSNPFERLDGVPAVITCQLHQCRYRL